MKHAPLASLALLGLCAPAPASEDVDDFFLDEVPVVLSASRLAQPVSESPAAMTVLDRDTILASGAQNIPDALRLVPGFQVSHIGGVNQTAQYHGLASQHPKRMQILIDGRTVYHAAFGGVHWDTLPVTLHDIERIEVLRGSNASSYGSNAFMGVVNIVTRHAAQSRGSSFGVSTGYNGTREATLQLGDRIGDIDYRLTLDTYTTDGYPNVTDFHRYWDSTGGPVDPATVATGTPYVPAATRYTLARADSQRIQRLGLRGDWLLDNGDQLLFELGHVRNDRDDIFDNGNFELYKPSEKLRSDSQLLRWSRVLRNGDELALQFTHNRFRYDSRSVSFLIDRSDTDGDGLFDILINFGPVAAGWDFTNDRWDLELQHTLSDEDGRWRAVWGAGVRLDTLDSTNFVVGGEHKERLQYRLFSNLEHRFGEREQWILNAGLMLEQVQDFGRFASPRLALNWHVDEHATLRIAAARAYRMPSFQEASGEYRLTALDPGTYYIPGIPSFYYTLTSNAGNHLSPERLDTLELGLMSINWIDGLSIDLRLFDERLDDYIDEVRYKDGCIGCDTSAIGALDPHDLLVHENAGWIDQRGYELQIRHQFSDRTSLLLSYNRTSARGSRIKVRDAAGNVVETADIADYVPSRTLSALLRHRFDGGWQASLAYYAMDVMNWPNDGDRLPPYERLDLRISRDFRIGAGRARLELIGQNLLDEGYIEFRKDNLFERRLFVRFTVDLP